MYTNNIDLAIFDVRKTSILPVTSCALGYASPPRVKQTCGEQNGAKAFVLKGITLYMVSGVNHTLG